MVGNDPAEYNREKCI